MDMHVHARTALLCWGNDQAPTGGWLIDPNYLYYCITSISHTTGKLQQLIDDSIPKHMHGKSPAHQVVLTFLAHCWFGIRSMSRRPQITYRCVNSKFHRRSPADHAISPWFWFWFWSSHILLLASHRKMLRRGRVRGPASASLDYPGVVAWIQQRPDSDG